MLEIIKSLAHGAGEISKRGQEHLSSLKIEYKGVRDLVTEVDKDVEDYLRKEIVHRFPKHVIVGEERGTSGQEQQHRWIIDPIDGTVSFLHGLPTYSISIAYQEKGQTVAGVVYAPALGQLFSAEKGGGAFLNGQSIRVSEQQEMIDSLWATGFACIRANLEVNNLSYLNRIMPKIRDIRRMGSAALDLAYTAAGKVDGFWELILNDYDVAAGLFLVQEAGGLVCDLGGGSNYPDEGIVATNAKLQKNILELLAE